MHTKSIILAFAAAALSTTVMADVPRMFKRVPQSSTSLAFDASIGSTRTAKTCDAAFGNGFIVCRPGGVGSIKLCYNPDIGEKCCANQYACPAESFCLVQNKCCPDGIDPGTCAINNGLTLPSDYNSTDSPRPRNTTTDGCAGSMYGSCNSTGSATATGTGSGVPGYTNTPYLGAASSHHLSGAMAVVVFAVSGLLIYTL